MGITQQRSTLEVRSQAPAAASAGAVATAMHALDIARNAVPTTRMHMCLLQWTLLVHLALLCPSSR